MTTLTYLSPAPFQSVQVSGANVTSDVHGLLAGVTPGSDVAKALNALGWHLIAAIPTVDPHVNGAIWSNSGTLTISAG